MNSTLAAFNTLDPAAAAQAILPCNGSLAWAEGVAALRPFHSADQIFAASDKVWLGLSHKAWQHAFDSHPRIGEQKAKAATATSLAMSAHEQSAAQPPTASMKRSSAASSSSAPAASPPPRCSPSSAPGCPTIPSPNSTKPPSNNARLRSFASASGLLLPTHNLSS